MTPSLGPARAFDLVLNIDLPAIAVRLEPMHEAGWWPAQPDHDRPTPHRPPGIDPDFVAGSTWDCGQGDERVRQGWGRMVCHLHHAEQQSTDVLCAALGIDGRSVPVCQATALLDAQSSVRRLRERYSGLQRLWEKWSTSEVPNAMWLARQLMGERGRPEGSPCEHVRQAMFEAQRAIPIVGNGKPPPPCTECKRIGSVGQPRKGGKCDACYQRRYRLLARQRQSTVRAARS
jgi:hypothetical protein